MVKVLLLAGALILAGVSWAGPDESKVSRKYHRMAIKGQVARHERDVRTIKRLHKLIRRQRSSKAYGSHPIERNLLCVHAGEGSWTDPNAPYYGGLQMDSDFAKTYARWAWDYFGTPDHWPISVQLAASIRAVVSGRGYYPWPTTARTCGLI